MAGPGDSDTGVEEELEEAEEAMEGPRIEFYGGKWASTIPLTLFIVWAIFQSGLLGIGQTSGLVLGALISTIVGMFFAKGSWKTYANTIFEGMTQRVAATAIVAWLWAGMFANTMQTGQFVSGLIWASEAIGVNAATFPAATFVLAAVLATGIGTGYGTTVAFVTTFFPAGILVGANPMLMFAAILSGAIFGDNLAPVSDTTIVSAVTQDSDIGGVVASRFKYAILAAIPAFALYLVVGSMMAGQPVGGQAGVAPTAPGLIHLVSMGIVIFTAISGRHIVEAISWGLIAAIVFNLVLGLAPFSDMIALQVTEQSAWTAIPGVVVADSAGVGGSLLNGAVGFFPLIVLTLLIVAMARIMIQGGGFEAIQDFLLGSVAKGVRSAELTMVFGTAIVNAMITINTAAEIAISPYIARIGEKFNINGYRRANILDANTSALGYIFPWGGGILAGYGAMTGPGSPVDQFGQIMLVDPASVIPYVFHGWLLLAVFIVAAITGFGREYISDRKSEEVSRV
jgi:Na+/H+ antiporter NhaC